MAFVDELTIEAQAGKGGSGVIRWLHIKGNEKGGPAGGNGGRGGDVVIEGVRDLGALAAYRFTKKFRAQNGQSGANNNKYGADGESIVLKVPVGTLVEVLGTGETYDVVEEGKQITVFKGGPGGYGNAHYKSSTNQNPYESQEGKQGQGGELRLTLKLIADVGFIGLPNAGKSSLLNALTRAKSKIGAYPFTTLDPHLGDFYGYLLADIPGLIEGASEGRGLGTKFLRHVERTKILIHLISAEHDAPEEVYVGIRKELDAFGSGLSKKEEYIVLSKVDLVLPEEQEEKISRLRKVAGDKEVYSVSVEDEKLLKEFSDTLSRLLKEKIAR